MLTTKQYCILAEYTKNGRYPPSEGIRDFSVEGSVNVMIISYCPNKNQNISAQLKLHYKYLKEAHISNSHLTDFIKRRNSVSEAAEDFKQYENKNPKVCAEFKDYAEIIKWEIEKLKPKKIFLMGNKVARLADEYLRDFIEMKIEKENIIKIPHFYCLSFENNINEYKKQLGL